MLGSTDHLSIQQLSDRVDARLSAYQARLGQKQLVEQQVVELENEIESQKDLQDTALKARVLLEQLTDKKREIVRTKIEALVTHGIQTVFGPDYDFRIEQKLSRNSVTFEYKIRHLFKGEVHESDLRGYHGGGLVALVGFLLRVVMVLFTRPARRKVIFLDETMAALDGEKRAPFARLLVTLADQLDMQFVLITHSIEYTTDADTSYEVVPNGDGTSRLELIS